MARLTYSHEERKARLEAAHEELVTAIEAISTSDQWRSFLDFSRQLPRYSARNTMWLYQQAYQRGWCDEEGSPVLGAVAGYRTWLGLGRHVRKGEHGLKVLAPAKYKTTDEETGEVSWHLRGFTIDTVFAACQTDGAGAIPEPLAPILLQGAGPDGAYEGLAALVSEAGFSLERSALYPENGVTSFTAMKVMIADRLAPAAAVKTLAHELAHIRLEHDKVDYQANRSRCEVEAESVAFLVCREIGLEADSYSFPYVATWCDGETKVVAAVADAALSTARAILESLEQAASGIVAA